MGPDGHPFLCDDISAKIQGRFKKLGVAGGEKGERREGLPREEEPAALRGARSRPHFGTPGRGGLKQARQGSERAPEI